MIKTLRLVKESSIVREYEIQDFKQGRNFYYIRLKVILIDNSELYVKEYVSETEYLYSFHWQYKDGSLIIRWDNASHHKSMTNRLVVDEDMHGGRKKEVFDSSYMLKYNLEFQKVRILSVR